MPIFLRQRLRQSEWMDAVNVDPRDLEHSLAFIRLINASLGYTWATIRHLQHFSRHWKPGQRIEILDVATGSADIPRAILDWARQRNFDLHIVALDRHALTVRAAARGRAQRRLRIIQADAFAMPFAPGSFDYVLCANFLHHLDDADACSALASMARLARRGIIIADLLRDWRAYLWICLLTIFARPIVRHDAKASVAQAFTAPEILALRDQAGLDFAQLHLHFAHRFVLAGEKAAVG